MVLREGARSEPSRQDLLERTALFGEAIVSFAKKIPVHPVNTRLIEQLVGAGTSVGANYCEADDAVSGKEFKQKIGISRKESKETMFFLRMVATAEESLAPQARILYREAKELNLIFGAIWRKPL
jgi:four helix bundle protein